jgi:hypothetical protein
MKAASSSGLPLFRDGIEGEGQGRSSLRRRAEPNAMRARHA